MNDLEHSEPDLAQSSFPGTRSREIFPGVPSGEIIISPQSSLFADVLLDIPLADKANRTYTYAVPGHLLNLVSLGSPVIVPFGRLAAVGGLVVRLKREEPLAVTVREITAAICGQIFDTQYLDWLLWIADRYACSLSQVMQAAIPTGLLARCQRSVRLLCRPDDLDNLLRMRYPGSVEWQNLADLLRCTYPEPIPYLTVRRLLGPHGTSLLRELKTLELVTVEYRLVPPPARARTQLHVILQPPAQGAFATRRQEEVLRVLAAAGGCLPLTRLLEMAGTDSSVLRRLEKAGRVTITEQAVRREPLAGLETDRNAPPLLTPSQEQALGAIREALETGRHLVYLLHGVTGSGKTEVYLQAIAAYLKQGLQAIVLVPEIALTPQTVRRFRSRFGDQVAIWHSALSSGERYDEWHRILAGTARIVVGTRSAIFAPCRRLGLIVLDEEHESTYKQEEPAPRYHARTVALERARGTGTAVILGSATPSVETYHAAQQGSYRLLHLPVRVENRPLPPVRVVDMRAELAAGNRSIFSRRLQDAIAARLERREQTILFLNRRGYATFVLCRTCGEALRCPHCAVSLIYHQHPKPQSSVLSPQSSVLSPQSSGDSLRCHYCDYATPPVSTCPACGSRHIRHFGTGTQKVEAAVQSRFPGVRVLRLDRDTTRRKESHQQILERFRREEADVLIGTQMVAKGLDFPKITLVGVLAADSVLNLPDFRAAERTFQLITQVAGRSGRSALGGEVIVQAYAPHHPSIAAAAAYRWQEFYEAELNSRQALLHPPFGELINLLITAPHLPLAVQSAREIAVYLREASTECGDEVLGPVPAILARLRGEYRQQVLIKCRSTAHWGATLRALQAERTRPPGVRLTVDVEPGFLL